LLLGSWEGYLSSDLQIRHLLTEGVARKTGLIPDWLIRLIPEKTLIVISLPIFASFLNQSDFLRDLFPVLGGKKSDCDWLISFLCVL